MSAGRCEKCGRLLYKHPRSNAIGNFAQIAHAIPVSEKGPRCKYKHIYADKDINDYSNILLLCYDCHKEIDEVCPDKYPPDFLFQIKSDFELAVVKATNFEFNIPTKVIKYSPNLHGRRMTLPGLQNALFPNKYIEETIDITLKNYESYGRLDKDAWGVEEKNLIGAFNKKILPVIEEQEINCSIFALGPIPLLIKLGSLLSNKANIDIYQLRKNPNSWEWETGIPPIEYIIKRHIVENSSNDIILILSLSGIVNKADIEKVISTSFNSSYEICINSPNDDFLRTKAHLNDFIRTFRSIREEIISLHGRNSRLHIFGAIPNSISIEIGRQRNENFDLPFVLYDFYQGEYSRAIQIGGEQK